jgi:hypothetical protein
MESVLRRLILNLIRGGSAMSIWMVLFAMFVLAWVGGFAMFHVAGGLIHLLLIFAAISIILHFVMGRKTA